MEQKVTLQFTGFAAAECQKIAWDVNALLPEATIGYDVVEGGATKIKRAGNEMMYVSIARARIFCTSNLTAQKRTLLEHLLSAVHQQYLDGLVSGEDDSHEPQIRPRLEIEWVTLDS